MNTARLTILHTNDMHGRMDAMARLSAAVRQRRAQVLQAGGQALFWDAGDALDRRYRLCSLSKGAALARVLNAMDYDLMTMGNDILLTYGPQAMAEVARRLACPVLAANCRDGDGPLAAGLQEATTVRLQQGPVVGVLGLTAPWGGLYESFGYRFPDFVDVAMRLAAELRSQGAQILIVLSHLGLIDDQKLAESVPGIDLIVGGHSHDLLEQGIEHHGVLIAQAGCYAEALGIVELILDGKTGRVLSRRARVERVEEDQEPDPAVLAAIEAAEVEAAGLAARPIGVLLTDLGLDHQEECALGNLTADALRERMQAEATLLLAGQLRHGLSAGTLTFGELGEAIFSTANPQCTLVHGRQILAALERCLDPAVAESRPHALRDAPVGRLQISGMRVAYDDTRPVGQRELRVWVGEALLEPDRPVRLAHSDAETTSQFGLLSLEPGQDTQTEVPTVIREVVEDYIRSHTPVGAPSGGRWQRQAASHQSPSGDRKP